MIILKAASFVETGGVVGAALPPRTATAIWERAAAP